MSEMKNKVNLSAYKKEMKDVLERLVKTMPAYKELRFFVKCVINHYLTDFEKNNSDIVVIGSNIPEELVLVSGKVPYWILGGSRVSSMWADDIVPRDTDPVSRSGLGSIVSGFAENALILIPLVNDSTRKLAYILKSKGLKVHTFHFPPVKDAQTVLEWRRQYEGSVQGSGSSASEKTIDKTSPAKITGTDFYGKKADSGFYGSIKGYTERNKQNVYFR